MQNHKRGNGEVEKGISLLHVVVVEGIQELYLLSLVRYFEPCRNFIHLSLTRYFASNATSHQIKTCATPAFPY